MARRGGARARTRTDVEYVRVVPKFLRELNAAADPPAPTPTPAAVTRRAPGETPSVAEVRQLEADGFVVDATADAREADVEGGSVDVRTEPSIAAPRRGIAKRRQRRTARAGSALRTRNKNRLSFVESSSSGSESEEQGHS